MPECAEIPELDFVEGDNDELFITLEGVNLTTATEYGLAIGRPSGRFEKAGLDIGELADGRFRIFFDSSTDLEAGQKQPAEIFRTIGGVRLTSTTIFFMNVRPLAGN